MKSGLLASAAAAAILCAFGSSALAKESTLYSFAGGNDGGFPQGGLVADARGNLYGVTTSDGADHAGVIFELQKPARGQTSWTESVLYTFTNGADGGVPQAGLIIDASGNLYGTTYQGGADGDGVVFELRHRKSGPKYKVLWTFTGGNDGALPSGRLSQDGAGNLYGTATEGGTGVVGVVFELSPPPAGKKAWTQTVLYNFTGNNDGGEPMGNVLVGSDGNLYGTSAGYGQYNYGTIYRLVPGNGGWSFSVLHAFAGGSDGEVPRDGLMQDSNGTLYGTTAGFDNSYGNVFDLNTDGSGYTSIYNIPSCQGCYTGNGPWQTVSMDSSGALYGTTLADGENPNGEIFKLTPAGNNQWTASVLYAFPGGAGSQFPYSTVLVGKRGVLYGTSSGSAGQAGFYPGNVWRIGK
jgi:uncharacterized repeat protein (TIGR03803 family)